MQMEAACTCSAVQCIESSKLCIVGIIYNGNMGTLMDDLTSGGAGVELVHGSRSAGCPTLAGAEHLLQ